MARYIDADALIKKIYPMGIGDGKYTINAGAVKFAIDNAPTADVVPRAEVEKLVQDVTRLEQEKDALIKNYAECMKDYAREIFEEIESVCLKYIDRYDRYLLHCEDFAELKKKYIKGD